MRAALLLVLPTVLSAQVPDTVGFHPLWQFEVSDTLTLRRAQLGTSLSIELDREVDVHGTSMGWYLNVVAPQSSHPDRNLLYHSLSWHGPYPTDLFAWIHRDNYFPDDRVLTVYGHPYDVRLVCRGCRVTGDSSTAHFVAGTVFVGWRKLSHSNPAATN